MSEYFTAGSGITTRSAVLADDPVDLGKAVTRYLVARQQDLRPTSRDAYRGILQRFAIEVGWGRPLGRIQKKHVVSWLIDHSGAPSGDRQRLSILRTFFRWHVEQGNLRVDPTVGIRHQTVPRYLPRGLPADVPTALLGVTDARGALIILLMVQEALRRCEVVSIEFGDVDPDERLLLVRQGKGGHQRVVPLSEETWAAMQVYLAQHPAKAGPLIRSYTRPHSSISPGYVSALMRQWRTEAGVFATPHRLRHTAATDMLRHGAHVRDVQAALGHASLATTQRYMPWLVADLRSAMGGRHYLNDDDDRAPTDD